MDALLDTPLGPVLLRASDQGLTGLYFLDQRDAPVLDLAGLPGTEALPRITDSRQGFHAGQSLASLSVSARHETAGDSPVTHWEQSAVGGLRPVLPNAALSPFFLIVREQLGHYFLGKLQTFTVPLDLEAIGTPFQVSIWKALTKIPYGCCVSYADLARAAGYGPQHSRATGVAVGKNPISILVPCHRIVSSNHRLTGYSGGLHRKRALLLLEGLGVGSV